MSEKSDFVCAFCSRILKNPINLPCGDSLCKHHLNDSSSLKDNSIKCMVKSCKRKFNLDRYKLDDFAPNNTVKNLLEKETHLSEKEKTLKKKMLDIFKEFKESAHEYRQSKLSINSLCHDRFQEIYQQLEVQRQNLKELIDLIYWEMLREAKHVESRFSSSLIQEKEDYFECVHDEENIKETFLEVKLDMDKLEEQCNQQQSAIDKIKWQNKQIRLIESDLKLISFKPFTELDQKSFGTFQYPESYCFANNQSISTLSRSQNYFAFESTSNYSNASCKRDKIHIKNEHAESGNHFSVNQLNNETFSQTNPSSNEYFDSKILTQRQSLELINLCEFSLNDKWTLLYRGSRDGFGAKDFHAKCDGHSNTLTVVKVSDTSFIFGGFASVSWQSTGGYGNDCDNYKSDSDAFIFSLINGENEPCKIKSTYPQHSISCLTDHGPIFGDGHDFVIKDNADRSKKSFTQTGHTYIHPKYSKLTNKSKTFLAGTFKFKLGEIEIFQKYE